MLRGRPSDDGRDRADGVIEDNSAWGEDVRDEWSRSDVDLLRDLGVSASAMLSIWWYT